jgi:hypothetical protein
MLVIWSTLCEHAEAWAKRCPIKSLTAGVVQCFNTRRHKHYHPAMAAAYLLDPINWQPAAGLLLPPFEVLTEQELTVRTKGGATKTVSWDERADAAAVIARISGGTLEAVEEELGELMLGKMNTLAVSAAKAAAKRVELSTDQPGKPTGLQPVAVRKRLWSVALKGTYPLCAKAAERLMSLHVSSAAAERNWSAWKRLYDATRTQLGLEKAKAMISIKNFLKLEDDEADELMEAEIALDHMA